MSVVVRAPFAARVLPLSGVPDPVFASGVVGPGLALEPSSQARCLTVHSPINGVVTKLKPHAAIITSTGGASILIHLGIDTVNLRGKGFAALVDEGEIVAAGDPLIHWDLMPAHAARLCVYVPLIVISGHETALLHGPDDLPARCTVLDPLFEVAALH